jgi:hypothetical protein
MNITRISDTQLELGQDQIAIVDISQNMHFGKCRSTLRASFHDHDTKGMFCLLVRAVQPTFFRATTKRTNSVAPEGVY